MVVVEIGRNDTLEQTPTGIRCILGRAVIKDFGSQLDTDSLIL